MKRRLKSLLFCFLVVGLVVSSVPGYEFYKLIVQPMVVSAEQPIVLILDKNTSASLFARSLEAKQLISSRRYFLYLLRFEGLAHRLRAGIYQVKPGESALQFIRRVAAGDVMIASFRIIEGSNLNQVTANLEKAPYLVYKPTDWQPIMGDYSSPEGLLLADTYNYNAGSEAKYILQLANKNLIQYLDASWKGRGSDLPYKSPYELLIAASILEKEAALPEEKKLIAGVVVNRLKKHMPLQMDPTVIYALGANYQGKLSHENMSVDSPYNTYRYRGLPPTPIAMVGRAAIDAAAHPLASNYLYFVAKGDGSHQFSETYDEQRKAISRYQNKGSSQ